MKTIFTVSIEIQENTDEHLHQQKPVYYVAVLKIADRRTDPGKDQSETMRPGPTFIDAIDRALKLLPEFVM